MVWLSWLLNIRSQWNSVNSPSVVNSRDSR
jgi:hypothetical protein